ncbi:MAG TPA: hypothetical protein VIY73_08040, partial [Polyangiaceae bacterium]
MVRPLRFAAPLAAAAVLSLSSFASAGDLSVRDEAEVLSHADVDALRALVAKAPFDVRVVATNSFSTQGDLSRYVRSLVSEPNIVVIGIDPAHHHVQVHFGTGSHVPQPAWAGIESAGNDSFKRFAWEQGAADIVRASENAVTPGSAPAATAPGGRSPLSFLGPLLLILLVGGVIGAVVFFARRRSQGGGGVGPYGYGGGGPTGGPGGGYPGAAGGYYGPGQPGGMGALGGGILGAGVGGLAGYELGKLEGEREQQNRDYDAGGGGGGGFDAGGGGSDGGGGNYDAGGGGSSWDDGGGGGGGGDSGGGGFDA